MGVARDKISRDVHCLPSVDIQIVSGLLNVKTRDEILENEATGDGCFLF